MSSARDPAKRTDAIWMALDRWLARDRACRALTRAVQDAQAKLRRAVNDDTWALYLALEERVNARHLEIVAAAIDLATRTARKAAR